MRRRIVAISVALASSFSTAVSAAPANDGSVSEQPRADIEADADGARARDRGDRPWIRRWAPERHMGEVGLYGGILIPSRRLELFEADRDLPEQGFKRFRRITPSFGLRVGYYPIRFFGVEGEAGAMPTRTTDDRTATLWGMRLGFVGQLGLWSVVPFVVVGGGMLNVASERAAVGNDIDASVFLGGGLKVYLARYTMLRLDVRDHITAGRGVDDGVIHSPEVLLGLSITLGRKKDAPPRDSDRDGIPDVEDACPKTPGVPQYDGCPIPDTDGDGILDPDDACVDVPGVPEHRGCPIPDTDGDGILDPDDACVDTPGVAEYKGCPIPDTDGDEILDPDDACVDRPETVNRYLDGDGCPDEIPEEVKKFSGVIQGITFATDKDIIHKRSEKVLQQALDVFTKFPEVRVRISGHTDDQGGREHNLDLSQRRAEAVKKWLVDRGIAASRIETRGAGPDEPVDSNATKAGRAKNRRIEFELLGK